MRYHWLLALILLPLTGCLLVPDDTEKGTRVQNLRPVCRITAGAATSDSAGVDYKVQFSWRGADQDGVVLRFQYAVDDTTTESAWTDTTGFGALVKCSASHAVDGTSSSPFSDWHTFYLRAIDNEYATSLVDRRYFNARTIAPSTKIRFPRLASRPANLVKTFNVEWEGEDLDSSKPEKTPAFYEYKMIRLLNGFGTDEAVVDSLYLRPNTMLDTLRAGDRTRWIRVDGNTKERLLRDLPVTQGSEVFVFAIRAVDEAGAVEPALVYNSNWIMFHIKDEASQPLVTVSERTLGGWRFPADGPAWKIEVPSDTPIRFRWTGDASSYGSKPGNVNYGLDVPDPQDERYRDPRGVGGWIGWGKYIGLVNPLIFPITEAGQTHVLYIRMRDAGDLRASEQLCTVIMTVVAFTFSRPALLVDDARIGYGLDAYHQDQVHDAFIDRFIGHIRDFTGGVLDTRSVYRPRGLNPELDNPIQESVPKLSELSQYATILYSFNYVDGNSSGIWFLEHEGVSRKRDKTLLSTYLGAGGKLFLFGGRPLSAILSLNSGQAGGDYPMLPPQAGTSDADFTEKSFVWRFLHVRSQILGVDPYNCGNAPPNDHQTWRDGLVRCVSTNPAYPDLYIDPAKYNTETLADCPPPRPPFGGIGDYEGILFDRIYSPFFPEAGLDTLYKSVCYGWPGGPPTYWNGAVIAQRYESTKADTLSGQLQGRTVLFMFQPYPFYDGPAIDAGTAAVTWLIKGRDY